MTTTPVAPTVDTLGADLHVGSVVVDIKGAAHRIDRITEYPGRRFIGDHARVAYGDGWEHTIADHEHFHCVREECRDEHEGR